MCAAPDANARARLDEALASLVAMFLRVKSGKTSPEVFWFIAEDEFPRITRLVGEVRTTEGIGAIQHARSRAALLLTRSDQSGWISNQLTVHDLDIVIDELLDCTE
jgi:hypothetical protein